MTQSMMSTPPLTHEAALAVPLRVAAKSTGAVADGEVPMPSGKDAEMLEFLMTNRDGASPAVLAHIDALISEGARPTEAQALHCAAANGIHELFHPLIERGADVNGRGANGSTRGSMSSLVQLIHTVLQCKLSDPCTYGLKSA